MRTSSGRRKSISPRTTTRGRSSWAMAGTSYLPATFMPAARALAITQAVSLRFWAAGTFLKGLILRASRHAKPYLSHALIFGAIFFAMVPPHERGRRPAILGPADAVFGGAALPGAPHFIRL